MPSWGELLIELQPHKDAMGKEIPALSFDDLRCKYIRLLSEKTGRNVISYYSGWLKQNRDQNIDINDSDITGFMNALKGLDCTKGLDLILHTPGGNPTATEGIVKYLRTKFNNDNKSYCTTNGNVRRNNAGLFCKRNYHGYPFLPWPY